MYIHIKGQGYVVVSTSSGYKVIIYPRRTLSGTFLPATGHGSFKDALLDIIRRHIGEVIEVRDAVYPYDMEVEVRQGERIRKFLIRGIVTTYNDFIYYLDEVQNP